jgi:uncharacterized protein (TIGR03435 family)
MKRLTVLLVFGIAVVPAASQTPSAKPAFEVASVKENTNNGPSSFVPVRSGDLIVMHNTRLFAIFNYAYRLTHTYQMEGYDRFEEGWKWYDIEVRAPSGATDDEVRLMFQSLLADRFKVRVHRETKEIPQFEFVTDKGKSKLAPSSSGAPMKVSVGGRTISQPSGACGVLLERDGSHLICHAATLNTIATQVIGQMHAPVVDRTGLTGTYDVNILFLPDDRRLDPNSPAGVASIEQALQEGLGLKLQKGRGPNEVLVIDHMEKPSEN